MTALRIGDLSPSISADAWVAPTATVVGDVELAAGASVYYGAVVRGDKATITVGPGSNLQDNVVVHADPDFPTTIGADVTVGHAAVLHGCTVEDDALIGMGAVVLNGAVIGRGAVVAAGAVVTAGTVVPEMALVAGVPAKVLDRPVPDVPRPNVEGYVMLSAIYRDAAAG